MDGRAALTLLVLGVSSGASFALFALGYALVYDVLGLMNLAHGDVLMIATFASLATWEATGAPVLALGAGVAVGAVAGSVVDQVAYRPLRHTADAVAPLVAALGAALVLRNLAADWFGTADRRFPAIIPASGPRLGDAVLPVAAVAAIVVSGAMALAVRWLLEHTRAGGAVLAVAQDLTAARLIGIPVWAAVLATYALAGAVAAVGGVLYASTFSTIRLSLGWTATVIAFTAAVLGGTGSLVGAVAGGLALGIVESFLSYLLPSGYRDAIAFGLLAAVLVARPPRGAGVAHARSRRRWPSVHRIDGD